MEMWKDKLREIEKIKNIYGEKINVGALEKELNIFSESIKNECNMNLPEEYLNFLRIINGIEFNGFILYGIDQTLLSETPNQHIHGLIENNKIWLDEGIYQELIFLGESNISWYVYDKLKNEYIELDNPSGSTVMGFNSLEHMLDKVLGDSLT